MQPGGILRTQEHPVHLAQVVFEGDRDVISMPSQRDDARFPAGGEAPQPHSNLQILQLHRTSSRSAMEFRRAGVVPWVMSKDHVGHRTVVGRI